MRFAVLLHGCGVYDGTEIQEAVLTYLAIAQAGHEYFSIAPDWDQHHVLNHLDGSEMHETRSILIESARIARGDVRPLWSLKPNEYDILALPGGFGTAKNLTNWAFAGEKASIRPEVVHLIRSAVENKKTLLALCMSPTTVAKALEGTEMHPKLTVGTTKKPSPYDIASIASGMVQSGATHEAHTNESVAIDRELRIVSGPCYMMEARIDEVWGNIRLGVHEALALAEAP